MPSRTEILKVIEDAVCRDRQVTYGPPEQNFERIAKLASVALNHEFTAKDVAVFLVCVKLGRIAGNQEYLDNWVDLAGYAVCGGSL